MENVIKARKTHWDGKVLICQNWVAASKVLKAK